MLSRQKKKDNDATSEFLENITAQREIKEPIAVDAEVQKESYRTADDYEVPYDPVTDANHPYEKWRTKTFFKWLCTREIARYLDRKTFIAVSVREAFLYVIFLILLTVVTFGSTPLDMFYFSQAMTTLYTKQKFMSGKLEKTFYDINRIADIWNYLESITDSLYRDYWYIKPDPYSTPEREFFYENKLIGMPQLRQVKVRRDSCDIHKTVHHLFENKTENVTVYCYGPYTYGNEDYKAYVSDETQLSQHFVYMPADETNSLTICGNVACYAGGGYRVVLRNIKDGPVQTLFMLKNHKWVDKATRAMFLEFTVYNGNINLFCIFKIIFERPPTGGIIPSHWNYVQKLIRYNDFYDFVVLGCELVIVLYFIFFTIQKILEITTLKWKVFTTFWCWVDFVILAMCYTVIVSDVIMYLMVQTQLPKLVSEKFKMEYASFDQLSSVHIFFSYSFAVLIAFAFFRLIKYLTIIQSMYQLQATISRSATNLLSYCVMFFYLFVVFALIGVFMFGNKIEDYQTVSSAIFALLRSSVGDFDYYRLQDADPIGGPIFFFSFVVLIVWILMNVFLAILVSKYEEVRSEVRIGGVKTFLGQMLTYWFTGCLEKLKWYWLLAQVEERQHEQKAKSPTESIRQYLRQAGYSELEIELFFKKYDITDAKISAIDQAEIDKGSKQGERAAPPPLTQKDILRYIIVQKLEYLESHYQAANKLLDVFLSKLDKYEARK